MSASAYLSAFFAVVLVGLWLFQFGYAVADNTLPAVGRIRAHQWIREGYFVYVATAGDFHFRFAFEAAYGHSPLFGVEWLTFPARGRVPERFVLVIADWVPSLPFFLASYWCGRSYYRLRRLSPTCTGRCAHCAYDLRAHRPGEKCPECGTIIPANVGRYYRGGSPLNGPPRS